MSLTYDIVKLAAPDIIKGVGFGSQNGEGERRTIMELKLNFITPVWTADATGKMHHVEATGLIGSLRWWYEALIRGVGGWACGATDGMQCELDAKVYKARREAGVNEQQALADAGLCPACRLFGATNWARRFSLVIDDHLTNFAYPPAGRGRVVAPASLVKSAYYFDKGLAGDVTLHITLRQNHDTETTEIILGLLEFIRCNAALGAKNNLGYGLFEWGTKPEKVPSPQDFAALMAKRADGGRSSVTNKWPNIQDIFSANIDVGNWNESNFVDFKYELREAFRSGSGIIEMIEDQRQRDNLRHFLLGSTDTDPSEASKIKMALLPNHHTLRVWGWIPHDLGNFGGIRRLHIIRLLSNFLKTKGTIVRWKESFLFEQRLKKQSLVATQQDYLVWLMENC